MLPFAGILFIASFLVPGGAFDAGWTGYAPLSTGAPLGQSFFNIGVQFAGFSSIFAALNFLVTIITMRAPGMTFWRMPLLVWANLATSLLIVAATPFIAGAQFMVLFDRALGTNFFEATAGGDVLSYQHIFWFYSHPAVYIMILPGFGIVSDVISTNARKPIFGYRLMALSLIGIVVLSYTVWAHHMFVSGMFSWLRVPMMLTSVLIAIPTGIKIFSWLATLFKGVIHTESTGMLFALGFVCSFILGGISGRDDRDGPVRHPRHRHLLHRRPHPLRAVRRLGVHDLRRHLPLVPEDHRADVRPEAGPPALLADPGRAPGARSCPMHWIGMQGMPRRVADYAAQFGDWNLFISLFGFMLGAAQLVFLFNMVVSWKWGPRASANPWRAKSIEWLVSSPPPRFNFDGLPRVVGGPYEFGVPGARHALMPGDDGYETPPLTKKPAKRLPTHA